MRTMLRILEQEKVITLNKKKAQLPAAGYEYNNELGVYIKKPGNIDEPNLRPSQKFVIIAVFDIREDFNPKNNKKESRNYWVQFVYQPKNFFNEKTKILKNLHLLLKKRILLISDYDYLQIQTLYRGMSASSIREFQEELGVELTPYVVQFFDCVIRDFLAFGENNEKLGLVP